MAAVAGLVLVVFGILVAVIGGFAFTQGAELGRFIVNNQIGVFGNPVSRDTMRSVLSVTPAALVISGVLMLISGAGVFAHKSWARWLGVLLSLLGLLVSIFAVSIAFAIGRQLACPDRVGGAVDRLRVRALRPAGRRQSLRGEVSAGALVGLFGFLGRLGLLGGAFELT